LKRSKLFTLLQNYYINIYNALGGDIVSAFFLTKTKTRMKKTILSLILSAFALVGFGQVTTSTISGVVKNEKQEVLVGAVIHATHTPTGTEYK
jgi:hypothetical protein